MTHSVNKVSKTNNIQRCNGNYENMDPAKAWIRNITPAKMTRNKNKYQPKPTSHSKNTPQSNEYILKPQNVGRNIALSFPKTTIAEEAQNGTIIFNNKDADIQLKKKEDDLTDTALCGALSSTTLGNETLRMNEVLQTASSYLRDFVTPLKNKKADTVKKNSSEYEETDNTIDFGNVKAGESTGDDSHRMQVFIEISEKDLNELMQSGKIKYINGKLCYRN